MQTAIVNSEQEFAKAIADAKDRGLRVAAVSDARLTDGKVRITFLPASAFNDELGV